MKSIRVIKGSSSTLPWEVHAAAKIFGKRIRQRFATRQEAEAHLKVLEARRAQKERTPLDPEIHNVVALFQDKLTVDQIMLLLTEGVERFSKQSRTLKQLSEEFQAHIEMLHERVDAKGKPAVSATYVSDCKYFGPRVIEHLGNVDVADIKVEQLDTWVTNRLKSTLKNGKKISSRTVKNEVNYLSALFRYAINKNYLTKNLTHQMAKLPCATGEVTICQPEEIERLLEAGDHFVQSHIMFGAFGGLRSSEIMKMEWEDVRIEEGQFYIEGTKNAGSERWVKMTPPLMDWCKQLLEGDNPPSGLVMAGMTDITKGRKLEAAYKKAGCRIPKNALRHSYGSHHLVHYQNADNTANEMGHVGPQMTFKAYRKAVLKSQAAEYFAIRCEAKAQVISPCLGQKRGQKAA
ncbi:MAG: hypothetical protein CL569_04990 [Alphaproteobacteria bacterium]|nr:hypothetical protein [Alphaproteobacteria bacterium]